MSDYKFNKWQEMWLEALESGEYAQSRGCLCDGEGFCCLGLACDVFGMTGVEDSNGCYLFDDQEFEAPSSVVKKLRLRDRIGSTRGFIKFSTKVWTDNLAHANDMGATFKQIARAIRKNPENFFRR